MKLRISDSVKIIGDEVPRRECRFNGLFERIDLLSLTGAYVPPLIFIYFHDPHR